MKQCTTHSHTKQTSNNLEDCRSLTFMKTLSLLRRYIKYQNCSQNKLKNPFSLKIVVVSSSALVSTLIKYYTFSVIRLNVFLIVCLFRKLGPGYRHIAYSSVLLDFVALRAQGYYQYPEATTYLTDKTQTLTLGHLAY